MESEESYKQRVWNEKWHKMQWSKEQKRFIERPKFRRPNLLSSTVPVSTVLNYRLQNSLFGNYMKEFNNFKEQYKFVNENKLGIDNWDLNLLDDKDKQIYEIRNNFSDELTELRDFAVEKYENIDYNILYEHLTNIRLINNHINFVDSLRKYTALRVLTLSGNWISSVRGKCLPRNLQFLELYANDIENVVALCKKGPKRMLHLGLGRNLLTNDSAFHLLARSGNFTELHTLDLSDNYILDLWEVLNDLRGLPYLVALSLEGNPCSVCETYKDCVVKVLPKLNYLDGTEILHADRTKNIISDLINGSHRGALTFTCYRLIGLPPPPKTGGTVQSFYLEVEMPLLEEIEMPKPKVEEKEEIILATKGSKKDDKSAKKAPSSKASSKSSKKKGKDDPYAKDDEYAIEVERRIVNNSFKTDRLPYAKVMKFKDPAIVVIPPNDDLTVLRDTFRSRVKVKIVYLMVEKPKSAKKGAVPPSEVVLKKITFATFFCDLHPVNWSEDYVNFIWADSPKILSRAIPVDGELRAEIYLEKGKKPPKKPKGSVVTEPVFEKLPLPGILTCHVGFGLRRHVTPRESET